jgi:hypothetical protein
LSFPVQIVWEDVFDETARIPRKVKENRSRKIQDQAGRTWNLITALYYKGTGRIPWRKMAQDGEFTACYIGVSFYREVGCVIGQSGLTQSSDGKTCAIGALHREHVTHCSLRITGSINTSGLNCVFLQRCACWPSVLKLDFCSPLSDV